ncbi:phage portal protein [Kitasatospora kazusensis]|uniref:Phage portal protein n=1 Tax=Kitasatospora kazusensis TaxID=407974 RepID=A0ABN2Z774_9ACTN
MSLLRRASRTRPERRFYAPQSSAGDPWAIPSNGSLAAFTPSGVPVTEDTAMSLLAVAACVRILSTKVAGLPFDAIRMRGPLRENIDPAPIIVGDPFGGTNNTAYPSRRVGFGQLMVSLLLRGNGYCLVLARDTLGRPTRLQVLHPDRVRCGWAPDGSGQRVYQINRKPVPTENIVHLMGMSHPEAATGMSLIAYARNAISLGLAAEEFGGRFFGNGAHMSGILEVPGDLDKERARALKESFTASHAGLQNAHAIGVLSGGAQFKPISVSPEDAQFLGTRQAQNLDIAMLFGVPPHMLGQVDRTTSWGTGIEQQSLGFLRYTLEAWTGLFEDAWSAMLPRPHVAAFDLDALLRTDTAGRFAVYTQARTAGIMTQDEIRARENLAPLPDGKGADINAPLNSSASPKADGADPGAASAKSDAASGMEP